MLCHHMLRILRMFDLRSTVTRISMTSLSIILFSARAWLSDLAVTAELAGLASMVAFCIPLTYWSFIEVNEHFQLQRSGVAHKATVVDHCVNAAGFDRWQVEISLSETVIRKWIKTTVKMPLRSTVEVCLTPDWAHCRLEKSGMGWWCTTLYLTGLIFFSITDTIESLYGIVFGTYQAVVLLHREGCSLVNISLHLLFAFSLGCAIVSNLYVYFWVRRNGGLPLSTEFEVVSTHSNASLTKYVQTV